MERLARRAMLIYRNQIASQGPKNGTKIDRRWAPTLRDFRHWTSRPQTLPI